MTSTRLLVLLALLLFGSAASGCDCPTVGEVTRELAGSDAQECGEVEVHEDESTAAACMQAAVDEGIPAWATWTSTARLSWSGANEFPKGIAFDGTTSYFLTEGDGCLSGGGCVLAIACDYPVTSGTEEVLPAVGCADTVPRASEEFGCE